jgi:hypothetical protein
MAKHHSLQCPRRPSLALLPGDRLLSRALLPALKAMPSSVLAGQHAAVAPLDVQCGSA